MQVCQPCIPFTTSCKSSVPLQSGWLPDSECSILHECFGMAAIHLWAGAGCSGGGPEHPQMQDEIAHRPRGATQCSLRAKHRH